jgi:hypothetical protein
LKYIGIHQPDFLAAIIGESLGQVCPVRAVSVGGNSVMARYIVKWDAIQRVEFDELPLAIKHVHTLPSGTVVEINDIEAAAGQPSLYIITAGRPGVVKVEGPDT